MSLEAIKTIQCLKKMTNLLARAALTPAARREARVVQRMLHRRELKWQAQISRLA